MLVSGKKGGLCIWYLAVHDVAVAISQCERTQNSFAKNVAISTEFQSYKMDNTNKIPEW